MKFTDFVQEKLDRGEIDPASLATINKNYGVDLKPNKDALSPNSVQFMQGQQATDNRRAANAQMKNQRKYGPSPKAAPAAVPATPPTESPLQMAPSRDAAAKAKYDADMKAIEKPPTEPAVPATPPTAAANPTNPTAPKPSAATPEGRPNHAALPEAPKFDWTKRAEQAKDKTERDFIRQLRVLYGMQTSPEARNAIAIIGHPSSLKNEREAAYKLLKSKGVDLDSITKPDPIYADSTFL